MPSPFEELETIIAGLQSDVAALGAQVESLSGQGVECTRIEGTYSSYAEAGLTEPTTQEPSWPTIEAKAGDLVLVNVKVGALTTSRVYLRACDEWLILSLGRNPAGW